MPILLPCFGSNAVLEALRRLRDQLRIVDDDLARIDVPDAERILHRRHEVLGVRQLGIVDRLGDAGLVHLEHLGGREALDVARAARQALLGHHLGAARAVAGLVLRDLEALRLEQRVLDVLGEQARVVAAPGADDDAPALGLRGAAQRRPALRPRRGPSPQRIATREVCLSCSTPPLRSVQLLCKDQSGVAMPADLDASRRRPAPASPRFGKLHHHAIGRRQAHMQLEHRAEIGDEFHLAGQAVVHPASAAPRLRRSGRSSQRGRPGRARRGRIADAARRRSRTRPAPSPGPSGTCCARRSRRRSGSVGRS